MAAKKQTDKTPPKPAKGKGGVSARKQVNCQLPGADVVAAGGSVEEALKPKHAGGRPPKFETVEEMETAIAAYFAFCDAKELPYGIEGLALALGMTRRALLDYEVKPEFLPTVKAAKQKVRAHVEALMLQGKVGSGAIFWLKNNAGWKDEQTTELTGRDGGPITVTRVELVPLRANGDSAD